MRRSLVLFTLVFSTGAATAALAAVASELQPIPDGLRLQQARQTVDFTRSGVRTQPRRGGPEWTWSFLGVRSSTGEAIVSPAEVSPKSAGSDRVRYLRGPVIEEYRLGERTVEQTFVIPEPLPLAGGDLEILGFVRAEGEFGATETGWRWRGPRGETTLGRATVLDRDGKEVASRFEVTATSTRLVVEAAALAKAVYPVVVDPEIGANDVRISHMGPDGDPLYGPLRGPAIAYNDLLDQYLIVWQSEHDGSGMFNREAEILGQVLSGEGVEIGSSDFRISFVGPDGNSNYVPIDPAVVYNSEFNEYLVVWSANHPEDGCADREREIWGRILGATGNALTPQLRISFNGGTGNEDFGAFDPAVAYNSDDDEYLVVWRGDHNVGGMIQSEFEIWAQRIQGGGTLIGPNLRVSDMGGTGHANYFAAFPDVAYNARDHEFLVVWDGDDNVGGLVDGEYEIFGQRLDRFGTEIGANDFRLSDMGGIGELSFDALYPAVAYNEVANEYLVVWQGSDNVGGLVEGEYEIFSQRLAADLTELGINDVRLSDAGGIGNPAYLAWSPDVAFLPELDRYLVVWYGEDTQAGMVDDELEIFAQLLDANGTSGIGPNDERISDAGGLGSDFCHAASPTVAANRARGEFLVAWEADVDSGCLAFPAVREPEIFFQRMDGMAVFLDHFESGDTRLWSAVVP